MRRIIQDGNANRIAITMHHKAIKLQTEIKYELEEDLENSCCFGHAFTMMNEISQKDAKLIYQYYICLYLNIIHETYIISHLLLSKTKGINKDLGKK